MTVYNMCGGTSHKGTPKGKLANVGSSVVNVGIDRSRLDLCVWKNLVMSRVLIIMITAARNAIHSSATFVWVLMAIPKP